MHHVGIAVSSLEEARKLYGVLGFVPISPVVSDHHQQARLQLLAPKGGPLAHNDVLLTALRGSSLIELVSPMEGSKLESVLRRDESAYHTCIEVESIMASLHDLKEAGAQLVSPPSPAPLFGNRRVAFVYHPVLKTLIELLERHAPSASRCRTMYTRLILSLRRSVHLALSAWTNGSPLFR